MTTEHQLALAAIEHRLLEQGVPGDEVDVHVADELRIPHDHYVAYQLVRAAIEAYGLAHPHRRGTLQLATGQAVPKAPEPSHLRRLFELAGHIHEAGVTGGDIRTVVREQARELIAELVALAEVVLGGPDTTSRRPDTQRGGVA